MLRWQIERLYMAEQLRRYKVSLLYETLPTTKTTYYCLGTLPVNILSTNFNGDQAATIWLRHIWLQQYRLSD